MTWVKGYKHKQEVVMSVKNILLAVAGVVVLGVGYFYVRKWMGGSSAPAAE